MKKYIIASLLCIIIQTAFAQSNQNGLAGYTGKYKMAYNGNVVYIDISIVGHDLVLTALWDNHKSVLRHLTGDNFIKGDTDWSVKFIRDKNGKVTQVLVRGADRWVKV